MEDELDDVDGALLEFYVANERLIWRTFIAFWDELIELLMEFLKKMLIVI